MATAAGLQEEAPLIAATRELTETVKMFAKGELQRNTNNHRILCGHREAGKSTLLKTLSDVGSEHGLCVIFADCVLLEETPAQLLCSSVPELSECQNMSAIFEELVKTGKRVLLLMDELHSIFRNDRMQTIKGVELAWTKLFMKDLHCIGNTDVQASNVLCMLTGSSAYTLPLVYAKLQKGQARSLGFDGYAACQPPLRLNDQKFSRAVIGFAQPSREQMRQMLELHLGGWEQKTDEPEGDGSESAMLPSSQRVSAAHDMPDMISVRVEDQLKLVFAATAGLVGPLGSLVDERPQYTHNLYRALVQGEDEFEIAPTDHLLEVPLPSLDPTIQENVQLETLSPACREYCHNRAISIVRDAGLNPMANSAQLRKDWLLTLQRDPLIWRSSLGNPQNYLDSASILELSDRFVIELTGDDTEAFFCFPWQPLFFVKPEVPPAWLCSALENLGGELGKKMEGELYRGMCESNAAVALRIWRAPIRLRLAEATVNILNFRTMDEGVIYQAATDDACVSYLKVGKVLWMFQVKLTLNCNEMLASRDFAAIRARFNVAQATVANLGRRCLSLRSAPIIRRVVLTNKRSTIQALESAAQTYGLEVVGRDQLEKFWPARVLTAARFHLRSGFSAPAMECFFPSEICERSNNV